MDRRAGLLVKDAGEMKGRRSRSVGDVVERDAGAQSAREIGFGGLDAVRVIGVRGVSAALERQAVSRERGFQHVGNKLKRRHIGPERSEQFGSGGAQPLREFVEPPEDAGIAGASDEGKRPFVAVVNGGIEFADDVIESARREGENYAAISAVGRMADAIGRTL